MCKYISNKDGSPDHFSTKRTSKMVMSFDFRIPSSTSPSTSVTEDIPMVIFSVVVTMTVGSSLSNQDLAQGVTALYFQCQFAVEAGIAMLDDTKRGGSTQEREDRVLKPLRWILGHFMVCWLL